MTKRVHQFVASFWVPPWSLGYRKQTYVTLNTAKDEYITTFDACTEAVWHCKLVSGLSD
jgi:hypothetical protein